MGTLPSYGTYYAGLNKIVFSPTTTADIRVQTFVITLFDGHDSSPITITIKVLNNPPNYDPIPASPIYAPLEIPLNSVINITVPYFKYIDGSDCMVTYQYVSKITATADVIISAYIPSGPLRVSPI